MRAPNGTLVYSTGIHTVMTSVFPTHLLTTSSRLAFSSAAATRSLSASCLLMASSELCVPGAIRTTTCTATSRAVSGGRHHDTAGRHPTLNRGGSDRSSFTRSESPMSVAMEQCGTVGVKLTVISSATWFTHT
jgi:hypothetical protein